MTEEQLKELARLQEQKALLERLLAQQRHVRTDVCTCWQIEPVYGMGAYLHVCGVCPGVLGLCVGGSRYSGNGRSECPACVCMCGVAVLAVCCT